MENIIRMIEGKKPFKMNINKQGWFGDLYEYDKKIFSVGKYIYDKKNNNIEITELPHGVFSEYIIKGNKRRERENKFTAKTTKVAKETKEIGM